MHVSRPFRSEQQQQKSPHPPPPHPKAFGVKPFQEAQKLLVCIPFFQGLDLVGDEARVLEIYLLRSVARKQSRQVGPTAQCCRRTHAPTCEDATPAHRIEPFISLFETHVQNQLCSLHCQGLATVTYCFGSLSDSAAWLCVSQLHPR